MRRGALLSGDSSGLPRMPFRSSSAIWSPTVMSPARAMLAADQCDAGSRQGETAEQPPRQIERRCCCFRRSRRGALLLAQPGHEGSLSMTYRS